ncbi:MAG: hypothetical protein KGL50_08270, partial [Burkholderiales bacterium]|nr:hypothetical protein [Burkholderiales bacterium]
MSVPPAARPRSQRAASGALAALLTLLPLAGLLLERGPQRPAEIAPRLLYLSLLPSAPQAVPS